MSFKTRDFYDETIELSVLSKIFDDALAKNNMNMMEDTLYALVELYKMVKKKKGDNEDKVKIKY